MAARITQQRTEVLRHANNTQKARVTQVVIEQINQPANLQKMRVTQVVIEVISVLAGTVGGFVQNPLNITY